MPSGPWHFEGRTAANTFNVDRVPQSYFEPPIDHLVGKLIKKGIIPLWNPYQACGQPLAAQYSTRVFFPFQLIQDALNVQFTDFFFLMRLWIIGFFFYLFLRSLNLSSTGAFAGGVFAMFSGSLPWFLTLQEESNVAMMTPITLYLTSLLLTQYSYLRFLLLAIAVDCLLLSGNPEVIVYAGLFVVSFAAFRIIRDLDHSKQKFAHFFGAGLFGILLASPLLLPFLEFSHLGFHIHRIKDAMGVIGAPRDLPGIWDRITTILNPLSYVVPMNDYSDYARNGAWDMTGGFLGPSCFLLAVGSIFTNSRCRHWARFMLGFGVAILLKNLGIIPFLWLGRLPLLNLSWSHRWAGPIWGLAFAAAAGIGFDGLLGSLAEYPKGRWTALLTTKHLFIGAWVICAYHFYTIWPAASPSDQGWVLTGLMALAWGSLISRPSKRTWAWLLQLVVIELWVWQPRGYIIEESHLLCVAAVSITSVILFLEYILALIPSPSEWLVILPSALLFGSCLIVDAQSPQGLPSRQDPFHPAPYMDFLRSHTGYQRIVGSSSILIANYASAFQFFDLQHCSSIVVDEYNSFIKKALEIPKGEPMTFRGGSPRTDPNIFDLFRKHSQLYSMLGVKYLIGPRQGDTPQSVPKASGTCPSDHDIALYLPEGEYKSVYNGEVRIFENLRVFPRVFFPEHIVRADSKKTWELLRDGSLDLRHVAIVDEDFPRGHRDDMFHFTKAAGTIEDYEPNHVEISVTTDGESLAVLSDTLFPGWKATVDGKRTRIFRINGFLRGVILAQGSHRINFKYAPESFYTGLCLAGLASLLLLYLFFKRHFSIGL